MCPEVLHTCLIPGSLDEHAGEHRGTITAAGLLMLKVPVSPRPPPPSFHLLAREAENRHGGLGMSVVNLEHAYIRIARSCHRDMLHGPTQVT